VKGSEKPRQEWGATRRAFECWVLSRVDDGRTRILNPAAKFGPLHLETVGLGRWAVVCKHQRGGAWNGRRGFLARHHVSTASPDRLSEYVKVAAAGVPVVFVLGLGEDPAAPVRVYWCDIERVAPWSMTVEDLVQVGESDVGSRVTVGRIAPSTAGII
jgi:hypothetical protein